MQENRYSVSNKELQSINVNLSWSYQEYVYNIREQFLYLVLFATC
jgi:hypothetical protein